MNVISIKAMNSGVSASFMSSLAKANVNIRVIAQGSSERQVAVVVEGKDGEFGFYYGILSDITSCNITPLCLV
jgi:aspartokinase